MRVLILLRRRNSWNINHKPPLPPALTSIPGQKDEEEEEEEDENIAIERDSLRIPLGLLLLLHASKSFYKRSLCGAMDSPL